FPDLRHLISAYIYHRIVGQTYIVSGDFFNIVHVYYMTALRADKNSAVKLFIECFQRHTHLNIPLRSVYNEIISEYLDMNDLVLIYWHSKPFLFDVYNGSRC